MKAKIRVLLACVCDNRFLTLKSVLDAFSAVALRARTCAEAGEVLCERPAPHLVLTDAVLPDGNWTEMLILAGKVKVIVALPAEDTHLPLDVMAHGAAGFITDSSTVQEIVGLVRSAIDGAHRLRHKSPEIPPLPRPSVRRRVATRC